MARWQLIKGGEALNEFFDDGAQQAPGEEGFSNEAAAAEAARRGADGFNYVGPSAPAE